MEDELAKIEVDGKETEVEKGTTILEAAEKLGIEIPTLCYHKAFTPFGACRLCTVQITQNGRQKLVTSCNYKIEDSIKVQTSSERVLKGRRMIIELLLSRCPDVEVIKDLARKMGIGKMRFEAKNEDCILCGLCVRACEEAIGLSAISFVNRGINREISTPFYAISEDCIGCGACQFVCPTGSIKLEKFTNKEIRPLTSDFNMGLSGRGNVYLTFPQAVPNVPIVDPSNCIYHLRGTCKTCEKYCEPNAIDFDQKEETLELNVGAIIVATGFDLYDASQKGEYGYGKYKEVITGLEFERLVSASGPTEGKISIDGKEPKKVVFIQCVGSREKEGDHEYCSRVCCMYTAKHAHLVKEKIKDAEINIFYTDVRSYGKGYEEFINRVKDEGAIYRRRELDDPIEVTKNGDGLVVKAKGHPDLEADLVVLAPAIIPRKDALDVARKVSISQSPDGFYSEAHPKLRPVETLTDGVLLAGCCQGPKDIPDSVAQASGAASRAMAILSKNKVKMEAITAEVDEDACRGCGICIEVCPYGAIELKEIEKFGHIVTVALVNEVLCKGCGACSGTCLSQAIQQKGFTDQQLLSAISGVIRAA